jgi:L-asparaginase II
MTDAAPREPDPVLVEVVRGPLVESCHRGAVAVCDAKGGVVAAWGDIGRPVYPRSAVKPLQALPLVESGAADRFSLSDQELALACASHAGDAVHVALVGAWLSRLGLSAEDLECGAHPPADAAAARALIAEGGTPSALHNNCSGKHTGMLTTARHLGEPTRGYIAAEHPVQRRIARVLGEMADSPPERTPWAVDGCGIPTYGLPLSGIATAMARLARPDGLGPVRQQAATRLTAAMAAHPHLVAGSSRLCTEVMQAAPSVLIKGGAEGAYAAILPQQGLGVALKIADGAGRAAEVAVLAVLRRLGCFTPAEEEALRSRIEPPVNNVVGKAVGVIRPAPKWAD